MARIRTLKADVWMSPQVMNLSRDARLLFIGLITYADDEGRGTADARKLKAAIFGGDDDMTSTKVAELVAEIAGQGLAILYASEAHGRLYCLPTWGQHQYIQKPKKSSYPSCPCEHSGTHTVSVPDKDDTRTGGLEGLEGPDWKEGTGFRASGGAVSDGAPPPKSAGEILEQMRAEQRARFGTEIPIPKEVIS